jgi:adenylate kinase
LIRMLLMGPPGAGKGTQASFIAEKLGIVPVSTGEIFRQNVSNGSPLGLEAESYIKLGQFVPDAVTNGMVRERLRQPDAQEGFLLDGYPRTRGQVDFLDEILREDGHALDLVLQLTADTDELVQRLLKRAESEGRADDTAEVIRHRMALYFEQTTAVTSLYGERGILSMVEGIGSVFDVSERINTALDVALGSSMRFRTVGEPCS